MSSPAHDDVTLPKQEIGSGSSSGSIPVSREYRSEAVKSNTWSYADEVYQGQSDTGSESESKSKSGAQLQLAASKTSSYKAAGSVPSASTAVPDSSVNNHASSESLRSASTDDDRSSWSFVAGESSSAAASRATNATKLPSNETGQLNPQVFTSEVLPSILAFVDPVNLGNLSSMSYDERVLFIERSLEDNANRIANKEVRDDIRARMTSEQPSGQGNAANTRGESPVWH
ncbi:hypothetical protein J3B02_006183, partial [Coemansia erecta]